MDRLEYKIKTFGCKVNTYDTGLLQERLKKDGFASSETPQVHILNTCAVTQEATREAIRAVRKIKLKNPNITVVVTGCAAQVDTDQFANLSGADLVVANSHKGDIENLIRQHLNGELTQKVFQSNIFRKEDLEAGGGIEERHTRTFLKIQDGCNSFCTYCIIPFARGKSRSIPVQDLVDRVQELSWNGASEVVLTGVHIGDYEDKDKKLEDLIETILTKTKIPRVRLSSLEPIEISDRLLDIYADSRMCPHFHMSIQSANTKVLADMRRKYTAEDVARSLTRIAKIPDVFVGMDVITGFPGETNAEFKDTYDRLSSLPWTRIHVFPYSERPGTKAIRIENPVPPRERKLRSEKLRNLSSERYAQAALDQVGKVKSVLVLKNQMGLSRDYWPVDLSGNLPIANGSCAEIQVKITGYDYSIKSRMDGYLKGIALDALG